MKTKYIQKSSASELLDSFLAVKILVFVIVLYAGFVLSMIIPLRPTVSQNEKRTLASFPSFSADALFSGSYFSGISTWYSDTFPFREGLITANGFFTQWHGFQTAQVHGQIDAGDDIPDAPLFVEPVDSDSTSEFTSETVAAQPTVTTQAISTTTAESTDNNTTAVTEATTTTTTEIKSETTAPTVQPQNFGAVLVVGNQAFEYYNFIEPITNRYITTVNAAADSMNGFANVYDIVVPNSTGIQLPESVKDKVNSSDQQKAISYMMSSMSPKVKTVNIFDTLMQHKSEYIYFRTDHHWTALGAYYAYEQLMAAKGTSPIPLSQYEQVSYGSFLGSFYASSNKAPALGNSPDELIAYKPFNKATMVFTDKKGDKYDWNIVNNVSNYGSSLKYGAFIGGDNPYTIINNSDLNDGSSCVVIKESYGNAFVPFLVPHYQTIHVIDYRYWEGKLPNFVKQNNVQDVIYINNISATRSDSLVSCIEGLLN